MGHVPGRRGEVVAKQDHLQLHVLVLRVGRFLPLPSMPQAARRRKLSDIKETEVGRGKSSDDQGCGERGWRGKEATDRRTRS